MPRMQLSVTMLAEYDTPAAQPLPQLIRPRVERHANIVLLIQPPRRARRVVGLAGALRPDQRQHVASTGRHVLLPSLDSTHGCRPALHIPTRLYVGPADLTEAFGHAGRGHGWSGRVFAQQSLPVGHHLLMRHTGYGIRGQPHVVQRRLQEWVDRLSHAYLFFLTIASSGVATYRCRSVVRGRLLPLRRPPFMFTDFRSQVRKPASQSFRVRPVAAA